MRSSWLGLPDGHHAGITLIETSCSVILRANGEDHAMVRFFTTLGVLAAAALVVAVTLPAVPARTNLDIPMPPRSVWEGIPNLEVVPLTASERAKLEPNNLVSARAVTVGIANGSASTFVINNDRPKETACLRAAGRLQRHVSTRVARNQLDIFAAEYELPEPSCEDLDTIYRGDGSEYISLVGVVVMPSDPQSLPGNAAPQGFDRVVLHTACADEEICASYRRMSEQMALFTPARSGT